MKDKRIEPVEVNVDDPTTKADCLNYLYDALIAFELANDCEARAVVLQTPRTWFTNTSCASSMG